MQIKWAIIFDQTSGVFKGGGELETYPLARGRLNVPPFPLKVAIKYLVVSTHEIEEHAILATFLGSGERVINAIVDYIIDSEIMICIRFDTCTGILAETKVVKVIDASLILRKFHFHIKSVIVGRLRQRVEAAGEESYCFAEMHFKFF